MFILGQRCRIAGVGLLLGYCGGVGGEVKSRSCGVVVTTCLLVYNKCYQRITIKHYNGILFQIAILYSPILTTTSIILYSLAAILAWIIKKSIKELFIKIKTYICGKQQYQISSIMSEWSRAWQIFKKSFTVDTSQQPIYMATRYRMGSLFATIAAFYNTFLLRQKILKNSIYITKSTNPRAVKSMCLIVGAFYFFGLYCLWHIPSFFAEIAVRLYVATEDTVTNVLLKRYLEEILGNNPKLDKVLEKDGLRL